MRRRGNQEEIDLGTGAGAIEGRLPVARCAGDERLDDQSLPGHARDGMSEEAIEVGDAEERMDETAVADVDLGRLHQPLADVDVPRLQPTHEKQVDEEIEVARHRLAGHAERAGDLGGVEHPTLLVRQHRPEPTQGLGGMRGPS